MGGEKPWENNQPETPQDEVESMEMPMDEPTETPTDEVPMEEDEVPPKAGNSQHFGGNPKDHDPRR